MSDNIDWAAFGDGGIIICAQLIRRLAGFLAKAICLWARSSFVIMIRSVSPGEIAPLGRVLRNGAIYQSGQSGAPIGFQRAAGRQMLIQAAANYCRESAVIACQVCGRPAFRPNRCDILRAIHYLRLADGGGTPTSQKRGGRFLDRDSMASAKAPISKCLLESPSIPSSMQHRAKPDCVALMIRLTASATANLVKFHASAVRDRRRLGGHAISFSVTRMTAAEKQRG